MLKALIAAPETTDRRIAYTLLRLAVGLSFLGHGLVRIPKLTTFHAWMVEQLGASIIPQVLTSAAGYVVPFVELAVGLMITFGALTRVGLIGGALLVCALIFGSTTIENWSVIGDQLLHGIPLVTLLAFPAYNRYSVDYVLSRRASSNQSNAA